MAANSALLFFVLVLAVSGPVLVPAYPGILSTLRDTVEELQKLLSLVSSFSSILDGGNVRSASAVQDCLDLLDLSVEELTWTISATQEQNYYPTAAGSSGGNSRRLHDLQSWLSAALSNQDTCSESLSGTNIVLKTLVGGGLKTVTNLVSQALTEIPNVGGGGEYHRKLLGGGRSLVEGFPPWMGRTERRLMQAPTAEIFTYAVVAADGSGNFTTVSSAVDAAPEKSTQRIVIYVKRGIYNENVDIKKKKWNIMLVGDGVGATVITGNRSVIDGWTTYRSATFAVKGKGFMARGITFENTAGPEKHQAVALRTDTDLSVFYECEMKGYQDTLYTHSLRQFFRNCRISGTVDFIFGNAAVVFQNCQILARLPLSNQKNSVTAHGRKDPNQNTGFSIHHCNITADDDLAAVANTTSTTTYLGRPWKEYSRTVVMQSYIGSIVQPRGWLEWQGDYALSTLYYGEYSNFGPRSDLSERVKWPGFHVINTTTVASNFTVAQFIDGNAWLPATGVKYTAGLTT